MVGKNLSRTLRDALQIAREEAHREVSRHLQSRHVLVGMLCLEDSAASQALPKLNDEPERLKDTVKADAHRGPLSDRISEPPMARSTRRAFSFALYEAAEWGRDQLSTAEVLVGLLARGEGELVDTLRSEG